MLKIKDNVDLKELEKFGFIKDNFFKIYNRPVYEDYTQQLKRPEYLLVLAQNKVIVKGKLKTILGMDEESVIGYDIQTNRVNQYIQDLIQAKLVEKVSDDVIINYCPMCGRKLGE